MRFWSPFRPSTAIEYREEENRPKRLRDNLLAAFCSQGGIVISTENKTLNESKILDNDKPLTRTVKLPE
jgi:hypothetical protein